MATITAADVNKLRTITGAGMMDCKKALVESDGDFDLAIENLRKKGQKVAANRSDRESTEGAAIAVVNADKTSGVVITLNCETDFVGKNEEFKTFVMNIAKQVVEKDPKDVEELLAQESIEVPGKTVKEVLVDKIATIGENMNIRRFARFESEGLVEKYIHGDGKIAVLVEMENATEELAKDVCMQIAAARPEYLDRDSVPADRVAHEMEILKAQAVNEGKPEAVAEKIVQGRIGKFYGEICLVEQDFVKDPDQKVGKLVESKGAKVVRFARFEKGEGLQKREENFAEEVAKQMAK